jgi:hypothetical protein
LREIVDGLSAWVSSHRYVDPNKIKKKEQSWYDVNFIIQNIIFCWQTNVKKKTKKKKQDVFWNTNAPVRGQFQRWLSWSKPKFKVKVKNYGTNRKVLS